MNRVIKSKNISRVAKIRLIKTITRPIITYRSDVWIIGKTGKMVGNILRKIYGVKKVNDGRIRRTNRELKVHIKNPLFQ